jgi:biopolymer transport protein ExbB
MPSYPEDGIQLVAVTDISHGKDVVFSPDKSTGGSVTGLNLLVQEVKDSNLLHIFKKGGPIMYPLLIASVISLSAVLERIIFLFGVYLGGNSKDKNNFFSAVKDFNFERAIDISKRSRSYIVHALGCALKHRETSLENASIQFALESEMKKFRKGIPLLDSIITLAPLLGLMGTVTGMMGSFSLIGGELSTPGAITGGIAEALIATAFGLGIAITTLIPFNYLNTKTEKARLELETAFAQLEILLQNNCRKLAMIEELAVSTPSISMTAELINISNNHTLNHSIPYPIEVTLAPSGGDLAPAEAMASYAISLER